MQHPSLESRAIAFAICAGAVVFILALVASSGGNLDGANGARALIAAIVCAALSWAYAQRSVSDTAAAIDAAIDRLAAAGEGDLRASVPGEVREHVPALAKAMNALFHQLHAHIENVQHLALYDPVTGLANRAHFRHCVDEALGNATPGTRSALLFIDLDEFKVVNDTLGHASGDMLLAMVGTRLRAVAEKHAEERGGEVLIGRLAGDEFTLFFPAVGGRAEVEAAAADVLTVLAEPFQLIDQAATIGASIGASIAPDHGVALTDLMRAADVAMYHAKASGRGGMEWYSEALASSLAERATLDIQLRDAVERDEFELAFQPQVAPADGRLVVAEALLRWRHPSGDLRLPGSFLHRAEESGVIVDIGDWVVRSVAATIARWSAMGVTHRLALNVSPRQLDHALFFRRLREALHAAQAPASLLELEITESVSMTCSQEAIDAMAELRREGAIITIDDFGTGYSNIARLQALPMDRVKLDRTLIERVVTDERTRAIVQSLVGLIHGLGCEVVGEGVESQAQADVLSVLGCDVIQGYAVARPMPEADFLAWAGGEKQRISA